MDENEFRRELGAELRGYRQARGWTRGQAVDEMSRPISVRALESYEGGERVVSAYRLVQLCRTLGVDPVMPIYAVMERLGLAEPNDLRVDLRAVLRDTSAELLPLRGWAMVQLRGLPPDAVAVVYLAPTAVQPLAALCDLPVETLTRRLVDLEPPPHRHMGGQL